MQILIDLILMWALMLGWCVVAIIVGALLVCGYVLIKEWSDRYAD